MPRLERVTFTGKRKQDFIDYLRNQINETAGDREPLERKWRAEIVRWRAQLPEGDLDHPFVGAPYSRDTEILTRLGWKRVDEVEIGEYVLTRKDEDESLEWNPIKAKPSVWAKELLHFKSRSIDVLCTPAHTMVVENQRREVKRLSAADIWGKTGYFIPLTGTYRGVDTDTLFGLDAGDVSEFIGWYVAEGSTSNSGTIQIAQKKEAGKRAISALLDRLGFTYKEYDSTFAVHARSIPDQLRFWLELGRAPEKHVPEFYFGASPRLIKRLLNGMIAGDGTVRHKSGYKPQIHYFTSSPLLAEQVQALAQLIGMHAAVTSRTRTRELLGVGAGGVIEGRKIEAKHPSYCVAILHGTRAKLKPHHSAEVVEYNDIAFCVTVDNHAVYVRRNGKACWSGNSNVEFPLTAIHSDPVYADAMQTLHTPEEYWSTQSLRPDRVPHANAVREALKAVEKRYIKMKRVNRVALLYNTILGTAVYKNHWASGRKQVEDYGPSGSVEKVLKRWSHPRVEHVPLHRFWYPANAWSLDPDEAGGAQWLGHEFFQTPSQLRVMGQGGDLEPAFEKAAVDTALKYLRDLAGANGVDKEIRVDDSYQPFEDKKVRLMEVWCRYDTNGDGVDEDIVAIIQPESGTLLRALHNPFLHGHWPFHVINYLPGFGIMGLGMAEIDEWAQEVMTKMVNAQVDNVLLANTRMWKAPLGSNVQPGEPIYPNKIWYVGPDEDVGEIRMSDTYQSLPQAIGQFMQFSELRTAVSELRQGNLSGLPSRTPATSLMSILREGNKRFDMILNGIRDVHSEMGLRTVQNLAQHFREDEQNWLNFFTQAIGQEDTKLIAEVLGGSIHSIEESFGVSVAATSSMVNKEVEKQNYIGLMQVVSQIYGQLIQTSMLQAQAPDPQTQQTAAAAYRAGTELLKRLLERFDIQNPSEYVPQDPQQAMDPMQQMQQMMMQQGGGGGMGVTGPAGGIPPQLGMNIGPIFGL